eukprot:CAMPEP_0197892776 /NCGR_PEP_ID=MMETSP1439-20131203/31595_1 /TAXON_ID=66791 /ORGANISM="Gonyaulax spinifera, Strain CCMP409" /LENGTH=39 /DNA_ID= /DNA_START= /DNA_END= /DNA_ORIENTATION=
MVRASRTLAALLLGGSATAAGANAFVAPPAGAAPAHLRP